MENKCYKKQFGPYTIEIETNPMGDGVSDSTVTRKGESGACSLQFFLEMGFEGDNRDYIEPEALTNRMEKWAISKGW